MDEYYYLDANQQQKGPIPPSDFMRTGITKHTLLWKKGMAGWQAAGNIPELSAYFQSAAPTPPPPPNATATGPTGASFNPPPSQKPANYLIWSILTTVLCCLPLGIVGIIFSVKVDGLWSAGDYNGAIQAAERAKLCCIISAVVAAAGYISMLAFSSYVW